MATSTITHKILYSQLHEGYGVMAAHVALSIYQILTNLNAMNYGFRGLGSSPNILPKQV